MTAANVLRCSQGRCSQSSTFSQTRSADGASGIALVEIYDADAATGTARLVNASTRAFVGTGASILIPGISVGGSGAAGLLIRAAGPALEKFGVSNVLADPVITVFRGGDIVAVNDDWGQALSAQYFTGGLLPSPVAPLTAASAAVGAFALDPGSRDAALMVTLPGSASYTVQVSGKNGTTGTVLVEFYLVP